MTHQNKGNYYKKHPEGTKVDESLKQEILKAARDGHLSCRAAEKMMQSTGQPLREIGIAVDILNIRIAQCQLGLFGFNDTQKRVPAADLVASDLETAIRSALVNGRLACDAAWRIADQLNIKRLDVSAACETMKIKVKPCQLGAF